MIRDCAVRRALVLESMEKGDLLILFSTPEVHDLGGAGRFYQDRDFFYLSAFPEPDSALVLAPGDEAPFRLFVRPRDPGAERWTGRREGVEGAVETFGADRAHPIGEIEVVLGSLMAGRERIFYRWGVRPETDQMMVRIATHLRRNQRPENIPHCFEDSGRLLHTLRLVKNREEIRLIRRSVEIAVEAFSEAIERTRVGMYEYQVEAIVESVYRDRGCDGPSFPTIVGTGANATYLHYTANDAKIGRNDLFLLDSGCLYGGYASDLTRTFRPDGAAVSAEQREIYQAVLTVQEAMIEAVAPGRSLCDLNRECQRRIAGALVDLGLLAGSVDEIVERDLHKVYFPHRLGHWLGSDVHDAGSYGMEDPDLKLEPGMLLTIEPGIYIPDDADGSAKPFAGIGVRIEDDILVTEQGFENLSGALPKECPA